MKIGILKKSLIIGTLMALCVSFSAYGTPFEAGTAGDPTTFKLGDAKYSEVVFVSGEAVLLTGKATITEDAKGKITFTATLANTLKKATLARKFVFNSVYDTNATGGQIRRTLTLAPGFTETITVGTDTYTLAEYYFSASSVEDKRAVISYKALSWNGRKEYTKAGQTEALVVDINAENNGYNSDWSKTEISLLTYSILGIKRIPPQELLLKKLEQQRLLCRKQKQSILNILGIALLP